MTLIVLKAFLSLVLFDRYLVGGDFNALYEKVRLCKPRSKMPELGTVERICAAIDMACIWYWKEVKCLQRSAATAWLLKREGVGAELVIGAQQMPFRAHAWVEVEGRVVNDKSYTNEIYTVLERC